MKCPTLIVLGAILLASVGAATRSSKTSIWLGLPVAPTRSRVFRPARCSQYILVTRPACAPVHRMNDLAEAIDRMGKLGASIQPVFIDLDPDRAALVSLPAYMEALGQSFLDLTGSSGDIEQAAKSFMVRVERTPLSADATDYVMKHISPIFVMRPNDPHPKALPATSSPATIELL